MALDGTLWFSDSMPLSSKERANLRTDIDSDRLERFLDQTLLPPELRAALLEAVRRFDHQPLGFLLSSCYRAQPGESHIGQIARS